MGLDKKGLPKKHKSGRKQPKSPNIYLERNCPSKFNSKVKKRLSTSKVNRQPVSLSKLVFRTQEKPLEGQPCLYKDKILVVVGPITNDVRMLTVPKIRVCALRVTRNAKSRILKSGGECYTFDQLARIDPLGENCILFKGDVTRREAYKHFGAKNAHLTGKNPKPYVRSKGLKFNRKMKKRGK